jgi:putative hydrolase
VKRPARRLQGAFEQVMGKRKKMIDLHTHTLLSDGELVPSELARRAEEKGYCYLGMTDHVDASNLDLVVPRLVRVAAELNSHGRVVVIPGAELTHVPPKRIAVLADEARRLGAVYIVVHGETLAEPVREGTNLEAILAGVEILAHPGLISREEVRLAAERNVCLEITARQGHSLTNGHVARLAREMGAPMVLNTDSHSPRDLVDLARARMICLGSGLEPNDFERMRSQAMTLIERWGYLR